MFSMASFLSGFSIGAIFGGIEAILGILSPVVSGDASSADIFFTVQFYFTLEKICLYLRFPSFVVA